MQVNIACQTGRSLKPYEYAAPCLLPFELFLPLSIMLRSLHAAWKNSCHSGVDCRRGCRHPHRAHQRVGGHADRNRSGTAIAARRRERPSKWHGPSKAGTVNPRRTRRLRRSTSDCRLPPFATNTRSSAVLHTATSRPPRSRLIRAQPAANRFFHG